MPINEYLNQVKKRFSAGISTEHSYRSDLQVLLSNMVKGITVTNEPKRQKCGAPDYIIQNKDIPLGYIEAKDIGVDLSKIEKTDQIHRYLKSLDNLIITDYIDFHFYKYGQKVKEIKIATIENDEIKSKPENFSSFETHIKDFCDFKGQTIKSAEKLAKMMAQKARMMEEVIFNAVSEQEEDNSLHDQFKAFKQVLIHDLDERKFSDIYAQTIAYGLFAARLHDKTLENFTRQEARGLIPRSNPFLRNLFDYVSGADLDERVVWIVDDLAEIFRATDLPSLLADFGKSTEQNDPFIHFYETFLSEYDAKLRKTRGVYYTPEPVVNFIVRAVDDILKDEFNLPSGLADTSKIKIEVDSQITDKRYKTNIRQMDREVHKVQILDPATGTGTFLSEVVKQIYKRFKGQEGLWSNYVEEHLITRLNGFEILMASYSICHLKLEILLKETNYKPVNDKKQPRLRVFLTNSLEEYHPDTGLLFASWLAKESEEANNIKKNTPVMVILGNPPYSGESANKNDWIMALMNDYKMEPGGIEKLKERNPKWINDDYVKFIRYGQHYIEKNGTGILAFINPHGFLDNPTFRGMRWNLLKTYDKIYTIDLHGNSNKKEICPDGTPDENVFDIQQGVSINLFIKTGKKKSTTLGKVFHYDLYGKRKYKYDFLWKNNIGSIHFSDLPNIEPHYFFVPKDFRLRKDYIKGFDIKELFPVNTIGIVTSRDSFVLDDNRCDLENRIKDFFILTKEQIQQQYNLKENKSWKIDEVKKKAKAFDPSFIYRISYRPFDDKYLYYDENFIERNRMKVMQHYFYENNIGLLCPNSFKDPHFAHVFLTSLMSEAIFLSSQTASNAMNLPLYIYQEPKGKESLSCDQSRVPNLNHEIVTKISSELNLTFTNEKKEKVDTFAPIDIFDYVYASLHSPRYRKRYQEFLKIDFPRLPYPNDKDSFWKLVGLGNKLRKLHLLESSVVEHYITSYPIVGSNTVQKLNYSGNKVWINDSQYFDNVPKKAWSFLIGSYQPAQKWLKDRKGKKLDYDDILHYQKIIVALTETDRIMKEIDAVVEF